MRTLKCVSPPGRAPEWPACCALSSFDFERNRREGRGQFVANCIGHRHASAIDAICMRLSSNTFSCFFTPRPHNPRMAKARVNSKFRDRHPHQADEPAAAAAAVEVRPCAHPGCTEEGACRVPKSREELAEHIWLCTRPCPRAQRVLGLLPGHERTRDRKLPQRRDHRPPPDLAARQTRGTSAQSAGRLRLRRYISAASREEAPKPRRPERQVTRAAAHRLRHAAPGAIRHLERDQGAV